MFLSPVLHWDKVHLFTAGSLLLHAQGFSHALAVTGGDGWLVKPSVPPALQSERSAWET